MLKLLVIGNGGREHAIAWKLAQSNQVEQVYVARGNPGTHNNEKTTNIAIDPLDFTALIQFAHNHDISFTIVGPEIPLSHGIVDAFTEAGLLCFGPNQMAAQLEASKAFSKDFMLRHKIPTAKYACFTDSYAAKNYLTLQSLPIVIKADGLAAGKGVVIATTYLEAEQAITDMLSGNIFGAAGQRIVIEEYLEGIEASFIVLTDGKNIIPLASAQDHKRRDDGDKGPNTGGMGAYSPAPIITDSLHTKIMQNIIEPTIFGMAEDGIPYQGFLYAGLMIDQHDEINVLEFNCRLGDPETQVILPRLQTDFALLLQAALTGTLDTIKLSWDPRFALGVVLTAQGYPEKYPTGDVISGLKPHYPTNEQVFHAGTCLHEQQILTQGGRVLCATALGNTLADAKQAAYSLVSEIHWEGMYYRKDIGNSAFKSFK
jgi:phosphoribosylamine--glycine ligase